MGVENLIYIHYWYNSERIVDNMMILIVSYINLGDVITPHRSVFIYRCFSSLE